VASISRLRCAPLFDQTRPFPPSRSRGRFRRGGGCQGRLQGRRALAWFGLDCSEHDGSRPTAAPILQWHCRIDL
jgi:hypothetical protein